MLLGGTEDARQIADLLAEHFPQYQTIYSLAGITKQPTLPKETANLTIRQGGFGEEIDDYLSNIDLVIDATHPFATNISTNIGNACVKSKVLLLHYQRRWQISANWQMAEDNKEMMVMVKNHPQARNILVALGGKKIEILSPYFAAYHDKKFYLRVIEGAKISNLPENCQLISADLPFTAEKEEALLKTHKIDLVLCRHSGAESALQKLIIAEQQNIPIVMLQQPVLPNQPLHVFDNKCKVIDFIKNNFLS